MLRGIEFCHTCSPRSIQAWRMTRSYLSLVHSSQRPNSAAKPIVVAKRQIRGCTSHALDITLNTTSDGNITSEIPLLQAAKKSESMADLLSAIKQMPSKDLSLPVVSLILRLAATLARREEAKRYGKGNSWGAESEALLCFVKPASMRLVKDMSWSDISTHLWAFAVLRYHPGDKWIDVALVQGSRRLGFYPSKAPAAQVSVALWALQRLGVRPKKRWVKKCRIGLLRQWRECPARPMTLALWSLSRMGDRPPEEWIRATLSHILLHAVLYSTPEVWRKKRIVQDTTLSVQEDGGVSISSQIRQEDKDASSQTQVTSHQSDTTGKETPDQISGNDAVELYRLVELNPSASEASTVIPALEARLRECPSSVSARWFTQARFHALVHKKYGGMTGQQYMMSLYSLAMLQYKPSDKWMLAYLSGSGSLLGRQALLDFHKLDLGAFVGGNSIGINGKDKGGNGQVKGDNVSGRQSVKLLPRLKIERPDFKDSESERHHWQEVLGLIQRGQQRHTAAARGENKEPSGSKLDLIGSQDLACLLWCMAKVQHNPPTWWIRLYEAVILPRLNTFSVQEMVTVVYGYGALRRKLPRLLQRSLLQMIRTRWKSLGPRGASNLLVALARLRMPPHQGWIKGLLNQTILLGRGLGRDGLVNVHPDKVQLNGLNGSAMKDKSAVHALSFEAAARCLWALGTLCVDPGPAVMKVLIAEVEANSHSILEAHDLLAAGDTHADEGEEVGPEVLFVEWRVQLLHQAQWGVKQLGGKYSLSIKDGINDVADNE